jgi:hypothetical protein
MSPTLPPWPTRLSSSFSRVYSPFAKSNKQSMDVVHEHQEVLLENSGTSIRRCKFSSPSLSSVLLRPFQISRILLPPSPLPRWSILAWTLPAHRPLMLGASAPPPPSSTLTTKLKKKMMVMTVTAMSRTRMTSNSCCYSFLFPFWCLDAKGGEVAI